MGDTYAEATWTQNLWDWIHAHVRAFEFFDGTSQLVIPDNLKSGVKTPCYYEPELNRTYGDLGAHYGVGILPARPYRPRDKAYVSYCTSSRLFNDENWLLGPSASVSFSKKSGVQRFV
jgi:transposase